MKTPPPNVDPEISDPVQVGFFQFLRVLQSKHGMRLGGDLKPAEEPVRLRADIQSAFPVAEIANYTLSGDNKPTLDVSFFGLFGASGALPQHYTQMIIDRIRGDGDAFRNDFALRDFLDLFNHRLLSMFYCAWEKHNFPVSFETFAAARVKDSRNPEDTLTRGLWALIGTRAETLRDRMRLPEDYLLFFAGHLSRPRPIASALESMLTHIFGVQAKIHAFQGQWLSLAPQDQSRPGSGLLGAQLNNRLGVETVVGSRIWNVENRFRVCIGPVSYARFLELTPIGTDLRQLSQWTRRYVGPQFDFDVQVLIFAKEVPGIRLGDSSTSNLGWNTWLGNWPHKEDASDAVFELEDAML